MNFFEVLSPIKFLGYFLGTFPFTIKGRTFAFSRLAALYNIFAFCLGNFFIALFIIFNSNTIRKLCRTQLFSQN